MYYIRLIKIWFQVFKLIVYSHMIHIMPIHIVDIEKQMGFDVLLKINPSAWNQHFIWVQFIFGQSVCYLSNEQCIYSASSHLLRLWFLQPQWNNTNVLLDNCGFVASFEIGRIQKLCYVHKIDRNSHNVNWFPPKTNTVWHLIFTWICV